MNYWEKFGIVAFDSSQKAIITSCSLKNPGEGEEGSFIKCCFSFTIRRDDHKMWVFFSFSSACFFFGCFRSSRGGDERVCQGLTADFVNHHRPSLIVGNFLPQDPVRRWCEEIYHHLFIHRSSHLSFLNHLDMESSRYNTYPPALFAGNKQRKKRERKFEICVHEVVESVGYHRERPVSPESIHWAGNK